MKLSSQRSRLEGEVTIPASKSHTIRGLIIAGLAGGTSKLIRPLQSKDTESCVRCCRALGAQIDTADPERWLVTGTDGRPRAAAEPVDVGNSGTTLFLAMTAAALADGLTEFTGDEQTRCRPATPLLNALTELGATAYARGPGGCAPLVVGGGLKGGSVSIECPTSQYMSSLLIGTPLAGGDTEITASLLNEKPYVAMTCGWLREIGVQFQSSEDLQHFKVPGRQRYGAFEKAVPADFSTATFFLVAAAITGSEVFLKGLDMQDTQGDKAVVDMLVAMGCEVDAVPDGIRIRGTRRLQGATFDLNATPDALPAMAVAGCFAEGETRLLNVPQARAKETDRIEVMARELHRLGANVEELPDGLIVRRSELKGTDVQGHKDHRVVMALAVAGLAVEGETRVDTAEAAAITFPDFVPLMQQVGARISELPS